MRVGRQGPCEYEEVLSPGHFPSLQQHVRRDCNETFSSSRIQKATRKINFKTVCLTQHMQMLFQHLSNTQITETFCILSFHAKPPTPSVVLIPTAPLSLEQPCFQHSGSTRDRCTDRTGVALSSDSPRGEGKCIQEALHAITPSCCQANGALPTSVDFARGRGPAPARDIALPPTPSGSPTGLGGGTHRPHVACSNPARIWSPFNQSLLALLLTGYPLISDTTPTPRNKSWHSLALFVEWAFLNLFLLLLL